MIVRLIGRDELLPALHLVWEVFAKNVAPLYTPEGVRQFQNFIKYDTVYEQYLRNEMIFFGAYDGEELCGVIAVRPDGHICLFYVRNERQGQGVGRMLFEAVSGYCRQTLHVGGITVNAAPPAVSKYVRFGMRETMPEQLINGIRYVPMEMLLPSQARAAVPGGDSRKRTLLIIGAVLGCLLTALLIGLLAYKSFRVVRDEMHDREYAPYDTYDEDGGYDYGTGDDAGMPGVESGDNESGIDAIPLYKDNNLSYEVREENYAFTDQEKTSTYISFNVSYPQISGLADETIQNKVNDILKTCAMETVDEIYTNPTDEVRDTVLSAEIPMLMSDVEYKVSYSGENFISVVYQDQSLKGSDSKYFVDLRTKNISLKDGTVYEPGDIVEFSDDFMGEWLVKMRGEADNEAFLSELEQKDMKSALEGDTKDGVYTANFFVDAEGVEIGYNFNYKENDSHDLGYAWVTAPFDFEEIKPYQKSGGFWEDVGR